MHLCSRFTGLETVSRYMMQGEDNMEHGRIPCIVSVCLVCACVYVCGWAFV